MDPFMLGFQMAGPSGLQAGITTDDLNEWLKHPVTKVALTLLLALVSA